MLHDLGVKTRIDIVDEADGQMLMGIVKLFLAALGPKLEIDPQPRVTLEPVGESRVEVPKPQIIVPGHDR